MVALLFPPASRPSASADERAARATLSRREAVQDAALVLRFNTGDAAAFTEIVTRHHSRLRQVAQRLLRNHADAEEIAQDTFIRAHRGLATFRGDSSLAAWLYRIALNLARNRYWYHFRRRRHASLPLDAAFSETNRASFAELVASDVPDPVQAAATGEFADLVTRCMALLPRVQREILTLRNVQQYSYREIAARLDIRVGTVKSRVARAREHLRTLLAPLYADPAAQGAAPARPWFESSRPAGLLRRAGS